LASKVTGAKHKENYEITLILTSPALGGATSIDSIVSGFFASHATAARQWITWKN